MIAAFSTGRLVAERLCERHFEDLCRLHQDLAVMATLGGCRSDTETRQFLDSARDQWERRGFGLWAFRDTASGRFVGRGGLRAVTVGGADEVDLAYALLSEFWGRGLATEMAKASLQVAFETLGLLSVACFTLPGNKASRRVMEKAGFQFERSIVHAGLPHVLYRMTASDWGRAQHSRRTPQ